MKVSLEGALKHEGRDRLSGYQWEAVRRKVLQRDDYKCVKCSDPATDVDHKVAVALGGTDDPKNLESLCEECHKKKTKQDVAKVARLRKFKKYKNRIGGFD